MKDVTRAYVVSIARGQEALAPARLSELVALVQAQGDDVYVPYANREAMALVYAHARIHAADADELGMHFRLESKAQTQTAVRRALAPGPRPGGLRNGAGERQKGARFD